MSCISCWRSCGSMSTDTHLCGDDVASDMKTRRGTDVGVRVHAKLVAQTARLICDN